MLPPVVEQRDNLGQARTGACSVVSDDCLDLDASSVDSTSPDDEVVVQLNVNLPNDVLEILGEEPGCKSAAKILLHEQLVTRWGSTIKQGFPKEEALILLDKYSWPDNLPELTPPKLNPEVVAALQKLHLAADSSHSQVQSHLGKGLCALAKGLTAVLTHIDKFPVDIRQEFLTNLLDSGRIFTNLYHRVSYKEKPACWNRLCRTSQVY